MTSVQSATATKGYAPGLIDTLLGMQDDYEPHAIAEAAQELAELAAAEEAEADALQALAARISI